MQYQSKEVSFTINVSIKDIMTMRNLKKQNKKTLMNKVNVIYRHLLYDKRDGGNSALCS